MKDYYVFAGVHLALILIFNYCILGLQNKIGRSQFLCREWKTILPTSQRRHVIQFNQ